VLEARGTSKDVKNEDRSGDMLENKGNTDIMPDRNSGISAQSSTNARTFFAMMHQLRGIRRDLLGFVGQNCIDCAMDLSGVSPTFFKATLGWRRRGEMLEAARVSGTRRALPGWP
jgi:hypothetical protein